MIKKGLSLIALSACLANPALAEDATSMGMDDMAAPVTHPTSFEDPRPYTEIRPIYVYHKIDKDFVTAGGSVSVYALQLRYAVNDRLGIIATKDGYANMKFNEVLDNESGFADLSVGAKYAFYRDDAKRQIATVGLRYEIPTGDKDVFQGQENGAFNPFLSAAVGMGPVNFMMGTGFRLAVDGNDSSFFDLDLHLDTKVGPVHPLFELNVYNVLDAGKRIAIADEGEDFFNIGSSAADGKTLISAAVGARVDLTKMVNWGVAYQFPLSSGDGSNILDYRVTTDLIFRF